MYSGAFVKIIGFIILQSRCKRVDEPLLQNQSRRAGFCHYFKISSSIRSGCKRQGWSWGEGPPRGKELQRRETQRVCETQPPGRARPRHLPARHREGRRRQHPNLHGEKLHKWDGDSPDGRLTVSASGAPESSAEPQGCPRVLPGDSEGPSFVSGEPGVQPSPSRRGTSPALVLG